MMAISGMVKTSTIDYPGLLSTVIFTSGCNFDCFYCHNRSILKPALKQMEEKDVFSFLEKRKNLMDGVVISGGEPLLQPDLPSFLKTVKEMGYRIKLDTNGSFPERLEALLESRLIDYVAVDYKAPWSRYPEICGCRPSEVKAVKKTFHMLSESTLAFEVRTTVIPQLSIDDLKEMANTAVTFPSWSLQLYRRPGFFKPEDRCRIEALPYTHNDLLHMADAIRNIQPSVLVRP